jgi:energy-converting hydrogenase Eha subunit A
VTAPEGRSTESGATKKSDLSWQQVVAAVAAAAGGAAWVSAVGSGVVALRLRQADLPIEPIVALMSAEHRFAIGAGILTGPLLTALIAFLLDWALFPKKDAPKEMRDPSDLRQRRSDPRQRRTEVRPRQWIAAVAILVGAAPVYVLLRPPLDTLIIEIVFVAVAVVAALEVLHRKHVKRHRFDERLVVFVSVLAAAGAGAILAEALGSPSFDKAKITVRGQEGSIRGGYITSTEHSVVLSTRCEVVEAVPRDEITRIRVGPEELEREHCPD